MSLLRPNTFSKELAQTTSLLCCLQVPAQATRLIQGPVAKVPFPDFSGGSYQANVGQSDYNGLLTTLEQQYSNGLSFLFTYTYSKTLSDAGDLLNGGSTNGLRAPSVPGLGPMFDWGLANFDIRQVVHFSGGYELPFGTNKRYMANVGKVGNAFVGGWSVNWITTLQGGQPLGFSCPTGTTREQAATMFASQDRAQSLDCTPIQTER